MALDTNDMIIYDVKSTPKFLDLEKVMMLAEKKHVLLWDSHLLGIEPRIVNQIKEVKVVDWANMPQHEKDNLIK